MSVMSVLQHWRHDRQISLMPGLPPKLPLSLDDKLRAMSAYLESIGQADFGVFNSISDSNQRCVGRYRCQASGDKGMNIASIMLGS